MKNAIPLLLVLALASGLNAGESDIAAYYKARVSQYLGKTISVDAPFVRVLPGLSDDTRYVVLAVPTVNDDDRASGGHILAVADARDKDRLVDRYGTNADRSNRSLDLKSLRGTLRQIERGEEYSGMGPVFIDMTDEGAEIDEILSRFMRRAEGEAMGHGRRGRP